MDQEFLLQSFLCSGSRDPYERRGTHYYAACCQHTGRFVLPLIMYFCGMDAGEGGKQKSSLH